MASQKLVDAILAVRKELLLQDEPLKAYYLLKEANLPELKKELEDTYKMVEHVFDKKKYDEIYSSSPSLDAEAIEPEELIDNPGKKYLRYGWIAKKLLEGKPSSYLDLGCYVGTLVLFAAKNGIRAFGVDLTKATIDIAKLRAEKYGLTKTATFFQENAISFKKVKADYVSAFEILEHVPDDNAFIKNILNLTKKIAFISTPYYSYGDGEGNLGHWDFGGGTRGHLRIYNKKTLRNLLERNGAKIEEMFIAEGLLNVQFCRR